MLFMPCRVPGLTINALSPISNRSLAGFLCLICLFPQLHAQSPAGAPKTENAESRSPRCYSRETAQYSPIGCLSSLDGLVQRIRAGTLQDVEVGQLYGAILQEDIVLLTGLQIKSAEALLDSSSADLRARAYVVLGLSGDRTALAILQAQDSFQPSVERSWALAFLERNARDTSIAALANDGTRGTYQLHDALVFPLASRPFIEWARIWPRRDAAQFQPVFQDHSEITLHTTLALTALYYITSGRENAEFLDLTAELLAGEGQFGPSLLLSERAVNEGSRETKAQAENTIGNTLSAQERYREANDHYRRSIELGRRDGWPEQNMAGNYDTLHDSANAELNYRASFTRRPGPLDLPRFQNNFADFLVTAFPRDEKRTSEALSLASESNRSLSFSTPVELNTLAECHAAKGHYIDAVFYQQRAIAFLRNDQKKLPKYEAKLDAYLKALHAQRVLDAFDPPPSSADTSEAASRSPRLVLADIEFKLKTSLTSIRAPLQPTIEKASWIRIAPYQCKAVGNPMVSIVTRMPDDWDCDCYGETNYTLVRVEADNLNNYTERLEALSQTPFYSCEMQRFSPLFVEQSWCRFFREIIVKDGQELDRLSFPKRIADQLAGMAPIARAWVEQGAAMTPKNIPEGNFSTSGRPVAIQLSDGSLFVTLEHRDRLRDVRCGEVLGFRDAIRVFDVSGYAPDKQKVLLAVNEFARNLRQAFEATPLLAETDSSQASRRKYWFTRTGKPSRVIDDGVHFETVSYTAQIVVDSDRPALADFAMEAVSGIPDNAAFISIQLAPYVEVAVGSPSEKFFDPSEVDKAKYATAVRSALRSAVTSTCGRLSGAMAGNGSDMCVLRTR